MSVDPRAATAFARTAESYERGRPPWPAAAVAQLVRDLGLSDESTGLDLAAGTGKLTRVLVPLLGRVIAIEPAEAMRAALEAILPAVDVRAGTAEDMPVADASVDAVFVGEAFHWFRAGPACREIARVLRPGGGLALLWNRARWTAEELPWIAEFEALCLPLRDAPGRFPAQDRWPRALAATRRFTHRTRRDVEHVQELSGEDFVALVASWSWIANLPDRRRAEVIERASELVGSDSRWRLRYRTEIHWMGLRQ